MISNHENMVWQWDWAGTGLIRKNILISKDELDEPQRQLGTIILPVDPPPIMNARPEPYAIDEASPVNYVTENDGSFYVSGDIPPKYYVTES